MVTNAWQSILDKAYFKFVTKFLGYANDDKLRYIVKQSYDALTAKGIQEDFSRFVNHAENEFGKNYDLRDRQTCHSLLKISAQDKVLDVGGGHNPLKRADVVADIDLEESSHRNGNKVFLYPHQKFVQASIEDLPFEDKEFDYVFCSQVLEHVNFPSKACAELQRVAKRGIIDTPRSSTDLVFSHQDHRWLIDYIDGTLFFRPKPVKIVDSILFRRWGVLAWQLDANVQKNIDATYRNVSNNCFEWENGFNYKELHSW